MSIKITYSLPVKIWGYEENQESTNRESIIEPISNKEPIEANHQSSPDNQQSSPEQPPQNQNFSPSLAGDKNLEFLAVTSASLMGLGQTVLAQFPEGYKFEVFRAFVAKEALPARAMQALPMFVEAVVAGVMHGYDPYQVTLKFLQFAHQHPEGTLYSGTKH